MWAFPLPVLMTFVLTWTLHVGSGSSLTKPRRAIVLALLAAFALLVPRYSALSPENGSTLSMPTLKVPVPAYQWAAAVNHSVPPGSPVAVPPEIEPWVVTFSHHAYPLTVRHYLRRDLIELDVELRSAMGQFLSDPGLVKTAPQQFRDGLDRFALRAVCLTVSPQAGAARDILQKAGFHQTIASKDYELWVRNRTQL